MAVAFEVVVFTPRAERRVRTASRGSETVICEAGMDLVLRSPLIMAVHMLPPPMKATLRVAIVVMVTSTLCRCVNGLFYDFWRP